MLRVVYNGVVSPFLSSTAVEALTFDDDQNSAIAAVYARGGVVLWDGSSLVFELDPDKAKEHVDSFHKAWQSSRHAEAASRSQTLTDEASFQRLLVKASSRRVSS